MHLVSTCRNVLTYYLIIKSISEHPMSIQINEINVVFDTLKASFTESICTHSWTLTNSLISKQRCHDVISSCDGVEHLQLWWGAMWRLSDNISDGRLHLHSLSSQADRATQYWINIFPLICNIEQNVFYKKKLIFDYFMFQTRTLRKSFKNFFGSL